MIIKIEQKPAIINGIVKIKNILAKKGRSIIKIIKKKYLLMV